MVRAAENEQCPSAPTITEWLLCACGWGDGPVEANLLASAQPEGCAYRRLIGS